MHRSSLLVALAILAAPAADRAFAQTSSRVPSPLTQQASLGSGRVHGHVRDDAGAALAGVSIVALGTTLVAAKSDERGRFALVLPAGEYVLRASREGYVSTYREPVRIQAAAELERSITLVRQGAGPLDRPVLVAAAGQPAAATETDAVSGDRTGEHAHTEAAWRLRHLTRTALRDVKPVDAPREDRQDGRFRPALTFLDWAVEESARAAATFFARTDFTGQVNFLTTGALRAGDGFVPGDWLRGVAYAAVGAPVGTHGDWFVRAALTAGAPASWAIVGEYEARPETAHAFALGVSYSAQAMPAAGPALAASVSGPRQVGSIYGADHWRLTRRLVLDYGLRLDRYDYVAAPAGLISPHAGARFELLPFATVTASAAQRHLAPGAEEFLPPASSGPWLPPERTFSALAGAPLRAERVRHYEVGFERAFGSGTGAPLASVRRYRQAVDDQAAALFGIDPSGTAGHYYVAVPGRVAVEGWVVGFSTPLAPGVRGAVDYARGDATWSPGPDARALGGRVPSAARTGQERLHDVTTSVEAGLAERTRVTIVCRVSSAFSRAPDAGAAPGPDARFAIELRQALPFQPVEGGTFEVLVSVRNLLRDAGAAASLYDELLTVSPPVRIVGGLQLRF